MRLFVVRHGETVDNRENRITGQIDVPLSDIGAKQAIALGNYFKGDKLDAIVSSDLQRARMTAQAIAKYHDIEAAEDPDLREISMGDWEGVLFSKIKQQDPQLVTNWRANPSVFTPPRGETLTQLSLRIIRALKRWQDMYPEAAVVWVAHSALLGVLLCTVLEMDLNRRWQFSIDNASVTELHVDGTRYVVKRINETAHIRDLLKPHSGSLYISTEEKQKLRRS